MRMCEALLVGHGRGRDVGDGTRLGDFNVQDLANFACAFATAGDSEALLLMALAH